MEFASKTKTLWGTWGWILQVPCISKWTDLQLAWNSSEKDIMESLNHCHSLVQLAWSEFLYANSAYQVHRCDINQLRVVPKSPKVRKYDRRYQRQVECQEDCRQLPFVYPQKVFWLQEAVQLQWNGMTGWQKEGLAQIAMFSRLTSDPHGGNWWPFMGPVLAQWGC